MNLDTNLLAQTTANVHYEFARLQSLTNWWHWLLLALACVAVIVYIGRMYRRDASELPVGMRWLLAVLRLAAFAAILFYFLDLEKRSERRLVKNSRAILLVDTSLSMGIQDGDEGNSSSRRRIDGVVDALAQGPLVERLRQEHDVVVYRFDESEIPAQVAALGKTTLAASAENVGQDRRAAWADALRQARWLALTAAAVVAISLLSLFLALVTHRWRGDEDASWGLLVGMVGLLLGAILLGVVSVRYSEIGIPVALGLREPLYVEQTAARTTAGPADGEAAEPAAVDWSVQLEPRGSETRLGDVLRYLIDKERGGPVAGIAVFTDGASNAGTATSEATSLASDAHIRLFPVGLGGATRPTNVAVVDLESPPRVYPGDRFSLTGYVQAFGLAGQSVTVELLSRVETARTERKETQAPEQTEETRRVTLGPDGEILPVKFEVAPTEAGRRTYYVRVPAPAGDHDARDNERSATIEVVERKNRVLLMAGGPSREFQFLRNLLFRDRETTVDVLLQSAAQGVSQEAHQLLFEFPRTAVELFEYDAVVAFDPDWLALDATQVSLLEQWVAEKAGGLILITGPVQTPRWIGMGPGDERIGTLRALYPVVFYSRGSATLTAGRFASDTVWPLHFSRDGTDAEFLRLDDDPLLSEQAWKSFSGVFGYFAVKDAKPGASVYARFSDPDTAIDGQLPVYLAGQFYGAGRVYYQGSGEMWRLRAIDENYFDRYYTKLIRWVSQGRLLRDSTRGVLLLDKERCLIGDPIAVRAILTDAQHQPLAAQEVTATLVYPDGRRSVFPLRRTADATREGLFLGQFTPLVEGDHRVEVSTPHAGQEEVLTKTVRARIPALETERPQRNDALLKDLAEKTRGAYFVGLPAALEPSGAGEVPLAGKLIAQDQVTYLPGTRDQHFERTLMAWLLALIAGVLCLEWLLRRLTKLA